VREPEAELSTRELAPFARDHVRSTRRTMLALGLVILGLGLLVLGLLAAVSLSGAAQPEDGVPVITGIALVIAVLPGFLMAPAGMKSDDRHPLVVALEQNPWLVRSIGFGYESAARGRVKIATVTLGLGREPVGLARIGKRDARSADIPLARHAATRFSQSLAPAMRGALRGRGQNGRRRRGGRKASRCRPVRCPSSAARASAGRARGARDRRAAASAAA
jgi:hypothetical protein